MKFGLDMPLVETLNANESSLVLFALGWET